MSRPTGHVSSDRLGEAARHASLDFLRDAERLHVESCERCRRLYGGYRLTDRLLAAPWREVKLPAVELERPTRGAILADRLGGFAAGFEPRTLAPITAIAAIVLLVGAAVALPRLIPAPAAGTASPSRTPSMAGGTQAWPSTSSQATPVPQATGSGKAPSKPPEPTPAITPTPASAALALNPARLSGDPLAWSPNGDHLLMWVSGRIQIRDASGRLEGGVAADAAAWYSPSLVAVATRSSGWRSPGTETVKLVDAAGHVAAALPGIYDIGGSSFAALLGSGSGELTIAGQGLTPGASSSEADSTGWQFVLWNGKLSGSHRGVPIAFTRDGRRLAVLHPGAVSGAGVSGWLEIVSVPSLETIAEFPDLSLRVEPGAMGSAYGPDAAFSPDGRYLLASGTLVDVSRGAAVIAGKGGWLADGSLVTASADGLLRWSNGHATPDPRFPGAGTVEASRHGELIYFYGDERPPLFLDGAGTLHALSLAGVGSIQRLLIAPDGRTIALDGRAADGSSIAAVASLTAVGPG